MVLPWATSIRIRTRSGGSYELATTPDLAENLRNGSVIPLRAIITNRGGPSLNKEFNLYYLHWWTLTHFLFESPRCRDHALELVRRGWQP